MKKIIILKYGELTTKKDNINYFLKSLKRNIESNLNHLNYELTYDQGRMFIKSENLDEIVNILKNIFGIHEIIIGYETNLETIENIQLNTYNLLKNIKFNTFKINTKRSNKNYSINSMEISQKVGAFLLKNINNIKVDVNNPDILMNLEIRQKQVLYYFEKIKGLGGYPVGTLGKGLLMLSGGIDSPVAGFLTIKRGVKLEAIYFESPPHTSEQAKDKVIELSKILANYNAEIKLHIINFTKIQETILKNIDHEYLVTIMRRMMYRISQKIAFQNKCHILVNGESIGQVASQTLTSMKAINQVVDIPVIRPVACLDKLEIIDIAKKIKTYNTSILPFDDCCTIFVPKHPVINPDVNKCQEFESLIDFNSLINEAINSKETIIITKNYQKNNYKDIL
ncbi:MAG: tRNA 4-thiouridine(8) synthase ThiI [Firmicutes bacterium]|nr:tRNA 4-thiouridine(8) synthase ThiI [Bacillota bacterium]